MSENKEPERPQHPPTEPVYTTEGALPGALLPIVLIIAIMGTLIVLAAHRR